MKKKSKYPIIIWANRKTRPAKLTADRIYDRYGNSISRSALRYFWDELESINSRKRELGFLDYQESIRVPATYRDFYIRHYFVPVFKGGQLRLGCRIFPQKEAAKIRAWIKSF